MSKTQVISTKVTPEKRQEIEAWAKSKGKSVSDYMQETIQNAGQIHYLQQQLKDMEARVQDMERRYRDATGRRIKTAKKITVPVTHEEYKQISRAALEAGLPRGQFLRELAGRSGSFTAPGLVDQSTIPK